MKTRLLIICVLFSSLVYAQKNVDQQMVPSAILEAKTIGIFPYWPSASTSDLIALQKQASQFIEQWGRFKISPTPQNADIVAIVIVGSEPGGFAPTRSSLIAATFQQWGQNVSCASGSCYVTPPHYTYQQYDIYTGTVVLIKGSDLGKDPNDIPILWVESKKGGSKPVLAAAKNIRKFVEKGDKIRADQDAAMNLNLSLFDKLTADKRFTKEESQQHFLDVLSQLKTMGIMRKASSSEMKQAIKNAGI